MIKRFLLALQFLTILPVKIGSEIKEKDFGASLLFFPLIGLLIGGVLALSTFLFSFAPALPRGALILMLSVIASGGLHLDGFADTCDGLYGNKPKERVLEIMRDSHIGAMGVIGITCLLLFKFGVIVSLPEKNLWKALIAAAVFSRWAQAMACFGAPYARREGKARYFIEYARGKELLIGSLFTLALFYLLLSRKGLLLFFVALLPVLLFFHYIKKRVGGMTGDTIGAISEFSEAVILFGSLLVPA